MKGNSSIIHVGIEYPNEKRKNLLKSAIHTVELLKRYEKFKKLKQEKEMHFKEVRKTKKEIKVLFGQMKELMPVIEIPKEEVKKETIPIIPKPKTVTKKPSIKISKQTEKLERDLQALKDRIARL